MCGICGWLSPGRRIDINILKKMNNIARHRGPDDEGYALISDHSARLYRGEDSHGVDLPLLSADSACDPFFLAFAHRRLSILDLSVNGHQPMRSEDGKLCVTFNGEIYNYIEVRKELAAKGYKFCSGSDTEVLLYAYREWGEKCVERFNGMWGFALWDEDRKKLFCSRDRLGAKPFYFYSDGQNFLFASELKQLCQNPMMSRSMNDGLLASQIMWALYDFSDECLIKDVKVLRGGYNLVVDLDGEINIYPYWDIHTDVGKTEDAIAWAMEIHKDAVRIRTRSDVPIGMMLSGGLDSSTLVADVSEYFKETGRTAAEINTFTSCYKGFKEGDESGFAHDVNLYCGTTENFVWPDETDTLSAWEKMIWHVEDTARLTALGAFLTVREISKTGLKVILNGQGSDETMFGYPRYYTWYLRDILREKGVLKFLKEWLNVTANGSLPVYLLPAYMLCFLNYPLRKAYCHWRMGKYASPYMMKLFNANDSMRKYTEFKSMAELLYNELRSTQLTTILHDDDRIYMAFSMESRVPFIDYRYMEEASKIPEPLKIIDGYMKYPLRKYAEGRLPGSVVWRRDKMGWPSPRNRWVDRFDRKRVAQMLKESRCGKYFNVPAIRKLWEKDPYHYAVEAFLNVEIFMRLFDAV